MLDRPGGVEVTVPTLEAKRRRAQFRYDLCDPVKVVRMENEEHVVCVGAAL